MKRQPINLECPDDAMDYPTSVAPRVRRVDQVIGEIAGLEQQAHRLHEMIPDWLRTIQDLCRERGNRLRQHLSASGSDLVWWAHDAV